MRAATLEDEVLDLVIDEHQLEDSDSSHVARLETILAAGAFVQLRMTVHELAQFGVDLLGFVRLPRLLAVGADHPQQSLGHHPDDGRGDQIRLDAHVDQSRDRRGRVVGVERAQDEVARQRRLDGDLRRLQVADFPDHDDIGVLSEDVAQATGERQFDFRSNLHLPDAGQLVFDRVLHGQYVAFFIVQLVQRRVEGRRLAAAGRAGQQNDAVGNADEVAKDPPRLGCKAHIFEAELASAFVQQPEHDAFAPGRGDDGDADIDQFLADPHAALAVLRQTMLGDVEIGHDLQTRQERRGLLSRKAQDVVQNAVDAETNLHLGFVGLDVDVAGPAVHRLEHDLVDQLDRRGLIRDVQQVLGVRLHRTGAVAVGRVGLGELVILAPLAVGRVVVALADGVLDLRRRTPHARARLTQDADDRVVGLDIENVRQSDGRSAVGQHDRDRMLFLEELQRQSSHQFRIQLLRRDAPELLRLCSFGLSCVHQSTSSHGCDLRVVRPRRVSDFPREEEASDPSWCL